MSGPDYAKGRKFRATRVFPPGFFDGLSRQLAIRPGDHVKVDVEQSSTAWPAFVLVANDGGENGWVPRRFLEGDGAERIVIEAYDTTTLDPQLGEVLELLEADPESGWLWCRDPRGAIGWFPISYVTAL